MGEGIKEGTVLSKRFQIKKVLAETLDSAAYMAIDTKGAIERVEIREIKTDAQNPGRTKRLDMTRKEAQILSALDHPHIPQYIDFFPQGDSYYLVTEYIEGDYLEDLLKNRLDPYNFNDVADWSLQLCDILQYLHSREKPVIVRNIRPSSILVTPQEKVKLMNFEMARHFDDFKKIDTVFVWNLGYTSPEQYNKQKSDSRSDIYSFGATLYNILTKIDVGSLNFRFPPISDTNPFVPLKMEKVIMKCLEEDPNRRYQTIFEVRHDVHTCMLGEEGDKSR